MLKTQLTILGLAIFLVFTTESSSVLDFPSMGIPENLFWGQVNNTNYLTFTRNTKNLEYCSGTWAIAATSVLSDRFKVLRNATWPEHIISPQVALSCISSVQGCNQEGDPALVYDYILQNGITDETCAVYQARDFSNGAPCDRYARCKTCLLSNGKCDVPSRYFVFNITGYAIAKGQTQMLTALQSGPIVCRLNSTNQFVQYTSADNILIPSPSPSNGTIYVSIVGYGVDSKGTNYWIGRNSWGIGWGDGGFFNLIRGTDALGIEEYCVYPTPNPQIASVTTNSQGKEEVTCVSDFGLAKSGEQKSSFRVESAEKKLDAVPTQWDWRNANGRNFISWTRNQNIPQATDYSWAFASASAVTDRFNVLIFDDTFPQFIISPQDIINNIVLDQGTGNLSPLYQYFFNSGFSDDTCLQYDGNNDSSNDCSICVPPAPDESDNSYCSAVPVPFTFKISGFTNLAGVTKMKQEIYTNGPITCGIYASAGFANYTAGIYSETTRVSTISQYVEVVGWGVEPMTKNQYWIGRNSLGTSWGNFGFFFMQMYRDNLGIETDCVAAIPIFG